MFSAYVGHILGVTLVITETKKIKHFTFEKKKKENIMIENKGNLSIHSIIRNIIYNIKELPSCHAIGGPRRIVQPT